MAGDNLDSSGRAIRRRLANPYVYGLGMLGLTIPGQMYSTYASFFYNDKLGLSLSLIATGMVFFTIWDAFNDPICGFLSDRTRTKIGRRRPWLLVGAPLFCLFFILFFAPPLGLGKGAPLAIYFTILLMLTETMGTVNGTNYHALFPELFQSTSDRASANAFRQALQLVGMIIGISLTPQIVGWIAGNDPEKIIHVGYPLTAVFLAVLGMGFLVISTLGSHENPEYWATSTPGLKESFKAVIGNKNFWTVSITNFFYQATSGLLLAGIPFFVKYALGRPDGDATIMTAAVFVTAIPFMWLWWAMIRKFGTLKVWRVALACLGLSLVPMFFANTLLFAAISGALIGISIAGVTANIDLINAKIIDEDAAVSGLRREGIYQSTISFVIRFSGLIRSLIFLLVTVIFGFVDNVHTGPNPGMAARFMISVFPVALMVLSFVASWFVKFEKLPDDVRQLEREPEL
jgi:glycoside/pentoside/hexuronide:cation symporter, GPH family